MIRKMSSEGREPPCQVWECSLRTILPRVDSLQAPGLGTHHCVHVDTLPLGAPANDNTLGTRAGPLPPNIQLLPAALPCGSPTAWPGLPQPSSWLLTPLSGARPAPRSHARPTCSLCLFSSSFAGNPSP